MAHILLPTDFSDASMHAAEYAVNLFGRTGNRYSLFHAYTEVNVIDPLLAMATADYIEHANTRLLEFSDRFTRTTTAEGVAHELVFGPLVPLLNDKVKREGVDIVVMGREGSAGSFFGSNTMDVIRRSAVPVLVVPAARPIAQPRIVVLADDYEDVGARDLSMLRTIALRSNAQVLVAHYDQEVPEGAPHWSNGIYELALKDVPHTFITAHGHGPVDSLERLAEHKHADMIAVLHRHLGAFTRLFHPSSTKEFTMNAHFPLLVLEQA